MLSTTIYIFGDASQVDCLITHFEKTLLNLLKLSVFYEG